ncbi:MAG: hypothetical protein RLZZ245_528 [Verrucomicrobiota bacterium]|jgi:hypothetical protein
MTNLDHGDYDPSSGTLLVRKGKGGKSRMLEIDQSHHRVRLVGFLVEFQ